MTEKVRESQKNRKTGQRNINTERKEEERGREREYKRNTLNVREIEK